MKALVFSLLVTAAIPATADPVILRDLEGRTITATVNAVEETQVLLTREDGQSFRIDLNKLSAESIALIRKMPNNAAEKPIDPATRVRVTTANGTNGSNADKSWETSWGSYDKEVYQSRAITVKVECTIGGGPAMLVVQWVGSQAGKASNQGVVKVDSKRIVLKPGTPTTTSFGALFVESDTKYAALGERDRDGLKYAGWIARVITLDGRALGSESSRPNLIITYPAPTPEELADLEETEKKASTGASSP